jgi:nucleoside-diphosphate-sugar epimerase
MSSGAVVAVTGAAGYLGSWITRLCLDRGYTVRACVRNVNDDRKAGFLKAWPEFGKKLSLHSADMTIEGAYDKIFEGCTTVFHPAEVFMSFGDGRDIKGALKDFAQAAGAKPGKGGLHKEALKSSQYIVDSINKSGTVTRLIYTASIASMMGGPVGASWLESPTVDESHLPQPDGAEGYGGTKRLTEKFFDFHAQASGGKWDMITGNPGDIVGPILAPHQAAETWQGKIGKVIAGNPPAQEAGGRSWFLVDVRDAALAEILLAESTRVPCGSRFLLSSGDKLPVEHIGKRAMEFYPNWDCPDFLVPATGRKKISKMAPMFYRVHLDNRKVREATGMNFRTFEDTFKATIESLVSIGGVQPKLKAK